MSSISKGIAQAGKEVSEVTDYLKSEDEKKSGISNFLQTSMQQARICPNCGKKINSIANIAITKCPFCKADLPVED